MVTSDPDPAVRWRAIVAFYTEFATLNQWEYLQPMVELAEWVAAQPMAAGLYPGTSPEWLVVGLHPGYQPELPFVSCRVRPDGPFECELWTKVGHRLRAWAGPMEQARLVFGAFVGHLEALAADTPTPLTRIAGR
jgi:hypothetical protein